MKRARKLLVGLMAMVMLLGTCLTANADTIVSVAAIKAITTTQANSRGQEKSISSTTVYTNADFVPIKVSYTWDEVTVTTTDAAGNTEITKSTTAPAGVKVASGNRGIANVKSTLSDVTVETNGNAKEKTKSSKGVTTVTKTQPMKATGTIELTAVSNGKTKITITENTSAKKKKTKALTVTVKTYADGIAFGSNVTTTEEGNNITVAVKGKLNLGASIANDASDKKLKYTVTSVKADGEAVAANKIKNYVTVDGKGNVSVKKAIDSAVVKVMSNDDKNVYTEVNVYSDDAKVTSIAFKQDTKATKDTLGMLNKKNVVALKGNASNSAHTYQLNAKLNDGAKVSDLVFTSNKPSVATVDANGKITACGNGTAVITATPKLGNSKSAKVTVKVTTDVEVITVADTEFNIIANDKDAAKIAAATNTNASNKKVTYEIQSVIAGDVNLILHDGLTKKEKTAVKNQIKKYVSVDGKGNVKAKKACTANVVVTAKADSKITQSVTVYATIPVYSIKFEKENNPEVVNGKATIYRTYDSVDEGIKLTATVYAKEKGTEPDNKEVIWTSNNSSIASVDSDGNVYAHKNGAATITAIAADGSGKKASVKVTVKTDAYDITVAQNNSSVIYVEGKEGKATNYAVASVIKATTNSDASNKKVAYAKVNEDDDTITTAFKGGKVSLNVGDYVIVRITANDTRTHGVKDAKANAVVRDVMIACVSSDQLAKAYELEMDTGDIQLMPGNVTPLFAEVYATDGGITTDTTITWKSNAAGVAAVAKDGTITAKKPGTAAITASYSYKDAEANKVTVSKTVNVYVGRKYADVQKEVNTAFTNALKAEDRSYTGVNTTLNTKTNTIEVAINNPNKDFTQLKETGLVEALQNVADPTYKSLMISDTEGNTWDIERNGVKVNVSKNYDVVLTGADIDDAISYVLEEVVKDNKQLKDWNGKSYYVWMTKTETRDFGNVTKEFEYELYYVVNVTMKESLYVAQLEETINANVAAVNVDGIEAVTYDAANNAFEVTVSNGNKAIAQADTESRAAVVAAFEEVFSDASYVVMTADTPQGTTIISKERTAENSTAEFINNMLSTYVNKLAEKNVTTFGQLDGSVVAVDVTYQVGNATYEQSYKVNFYLSEKAFDNMADKAIAEILAGKEFAFGKVAYVADTNALSVEFNQDYAEKAPLDLAGTGIKSVFEQMISNANVQEAVVIVDGTATTVKVDDVSSDAAEILKTIANGIDKNCKMVGKDVSIRVLYKSAEGRTEKALVYTIEFSLAEGVTVSSVEEESTVEETATEEESTEETTTEEESTEETTTEEESTEETTTEEESTEETTTEEESTEETTTEEESTEETTTEEESTVEETEVEEAATEEVTTVEETTAE